MATVNFLYRSKRDKAPLNLRLLFRHNEKDFAIGAKTKYLIEKDYWKNDHFKNRKDAKIKAKQIKVNKDLNDITTFILEHFSEQDLSQIDKNWLLEKLNQYYNPKKTYQLNEEVIFWIEKIVDEAHLRNNGKGGIGLSKSRVNSYLRLSKLFNDFQSNNNFKIKDLNKLVFDKFKKWLLDDQNYSTTYASKKLSDLKGVCKEARSNGIETSKELIDIKTKQQSAYENDMDVIILTTEEIKKIEGITLNNDALINARKWLLLACYTGQRGGDLINITAENFKTKGNLNMIELIQQKTGKKIDIPVLPIVQKIYSDGLPYKVSTQKLNKHFKEIGKLAEIIEPVLGRLQCKETKRSIKEIRPKFQYMSTHIGRRSFASNHYGKISTPIIMKVTGHSKESTFLTYINQNDNRHIEAFDEYYRNNV